MLLHINEIAFISYILGDEKEHSQTLIIVTIVSIASIVSERGVRRDVIMSLSLVSGINQILSFLASVSLTMRRERNSILYHAFHSVIKRCVGRCNYETLIDFLHILNHFHPLHLYL